jgi:hypothetical protein
MSNPITRVIRNTFGKSTNPGNKFSPGETGEVAPPANQADHDAGDREQRQEGRND